MLKASEPNEFGFCVSRRFLLHVRFFSLVEEAWSQKVQQKLLQRQLRPVPYGKTVYPMHKHKATPRERWSAGKTRPVVLCWIGGRPVTKVSIGVAQLKCSVGFFLTAVFVAVEEVGVGIIQAFVHTERWHLCHTQIRQASCWSQVRALSKRL